MKANLDWPLILTVGLATGALMGTLGLFNLYGPAIEFSIWVVLALAVWVPILVLKVRRRVFTNGLMIGVVTGVATGLVQALAVNVYLSNHTAQAQQFGTTPTVGVAFFLLVTALIAGTVWGLVFGGIAHFIARRRGATRAATPA